MSVLCTHTVAGIAVKMTAFNVMSLHRTGMILGKSNHILKPCIPSLISQFCGSGSGRVFTDDSVHNLTHNRLQEKHSASGNRINSCDNVLLTRFRTSNHNVRYSHHRPTHLQEIHLSDDMASRHFVYGLEQTERTKLLEQLQKFEDSRQQSGDGNVPTRAQLKLVFMHKSLPFFGFGFLDNFLMIIAGEYIDVTLGAMFGISTMAAAGLGNLMSDISGLQTAAYVEVLVSRLKVKIPNLSPSQVTMKITKRWGNWGKLCGLALGCIVGMCPLLFFNNEDKKEEAEKKQEAEEKPKVDSKQEIARKQEVKSGSS